MAKSHQQSLPETGQQEIPEIEKAAEEYADARDDRLAHGRVEKERKTKLIELMHQHKLETYNNADHDPPISIELVPGPESVKVKIKGEEDED